MSDASGAPQAGPGGPADSPASPVPAGRRKDGGGSLPGLKEIIAAVLALGIAAVALVLLVATFVAAGKTGPQAIDVFGRKKDVLQFVLPILGAVIGYYFGRVPAERRAEQAEQMATGAQE